MIHKPILWPSLLRYGIGVKQVNSRGVRSYSQQGGFSNARRSGPDIVANGPLGIGRIRRRSINLHNKLLIEVVVGQSNGNGFTSSIGGVEDPTTVFTLQNSIPRLYCYKGGVSPNQAGITLASVNELIDAAQYQDSLVPLKEGINTGRDPGEEFTHEQMATSYGEVIAAAAPNDCAVLVINVSVGGAIFNEEMINVVSVSGLSWSSADGGTGTVVFSAAGNVGVDDLIIIQNSPQTGYNGTFRTITSDGTTATFALVSNPGVYTTGASAIVWAPPLVNARAMVRYAVDTIAPAMGLTPYLDTFIIAGFEGNTNTDTAAAWNLQQWTYARPIADEFGVICGNGDGIPWIGWGMIDYPRFNHSDSFGGQNCSNPTAAGVLNASLTLSNRLFTRAQYGSRGGGLGDATTVASHKGVQGHSDNGEGLANIRIDIHNGDFTTRTPPMIDETIGLSRTANSRVTSGQFTEAVVIDGSGAITDPGNYGFQAFEGAYSTGGANERDVDLASVALGVDGLTFTTTLAQDAVDGGNNFIGIAYNNAYASPRVISTPILSVTWAADVATFTLESAPPVAIVVGEDVSIVRYYPLGYTVTGPALAGTTGTTLKLAVVGDPGTQALGTASWANGVATYPLASGTHGMSVGNYVNVTGYATRTAYNVTQTRIRSVTASGFSVVLLTDPGGTDTGGAYTGGGNVAVTGAFGNGPINGLRSLIRAKEIKHFSIRTGKALPRYAAQQIVQSTVNPSSKRIMTMLTELNLNDEFQLVLQPGDSGCYSGTGTSLVNLGPSGSANNFTMQNGIVFAGSANALDNTAYLNASGTNRYISPASTPDVFTDIHKIGGKGTFIAGIKLPASLSSTQYIGTTTDNTGPGMRLQVSSARAVNLTILNSVPANVLSQSNRFLVASDFAIVGFSIENLNNASWIVSAVTGTVTFTNINVVYSSPSSAAAHSLLHIGRNGTGATVLNTGMQIHWVLGSNNFYSIQQITPLFNGLYRELMLNLP